MPDRLCKMGKKGMRRATVRHRPDHTLGHPNHRLGRTSRRRLLLHPKPSRPLVPPHRTVLHRRQTPHAPIRLHPDTIPIEVLPR